MKISLNWLKDYVELPSVDELCKRLTMAGLEVEGVESPGAGLKGVVVAQIVESVQHPNADKLSVTKIACGLAEPIQVVCGAKNYKVGDKVPLATIGTTLPGGLTIKQAPLRGVDSFGMLCSSKELAITEESSGLLILDPSLAVGTPIAEALGMNDVVLELNVTPNRADALSHLGVAREVATLLGKPLKLPTVTLKESTEIVDFVIRIEDSTRCLRYAARVIEGVKVGPSPKWLQDRLKAVGVRSINNLVDVTNYVLFETGQPLHAFDLDKLAGGQIVVRTAKPNERIKTLDDKDRELHAEDLLICDRDSAQVIAGVMGGAHSEVTNATTNVLLECATFLPSSVRRSAKRHALHTESSHRFERGTDISNVPNVLDRAAQLIAELGQGTVLKGRIDEYPNPKAPAQVTLRVARVNEVLGTQIPASECHRILTALGFQRVSGTDDVVTYSVPQVRVDVSIEEDLIEEIARVYGYDAIPMSLPRGLSGLEAERPLANVERRIRQSMAGQGFDEVVNFSFVGKAELEAFGAAEGAITVSNPIAADQSVMRTTLLPSLVANVTRSARHQAQGVRFYEYARTYRPNPAGGKGSAPAAVETAHVAGAVWGVRDGEKSWANKDIAADFYDAKAAVESLLESLHIDGVTFAAFESPWFHPRASAQVLRGKTVLGVIGELHPRAMKKLDAPAGVFLFQLDLKPLVAAAKLVPQAASLSKFPSVQRDLAVVVEQPVASDSVRSVILEVGKPLVRDALVFDVYTGPQLGEGKKNLAYALTYAADDRTLTDAEVTAAHQRIVAEVSKRLGGALRE